MIPSLNTLKLPDPWQHQAVNLLREGSDVIVSAPTGAGKTYIFELLHHSRSLNGQAVYTVPTRALANDKYAEWRDAKWEAGIATGDVSENAHAPVLVATLETQLERLLRGEGPALLVIDEYQMIADGSRGAHYEGAVALAPPGTRLLLLSGSVANPEDVAEWLRRLGRPAQVVQTRERPVPLEEAPLETLPQRMTRHLQHYWPKFAAAVLLADLAPLLIFAPRRKEAESIAKRLASDLPQGDPLDLTAEQRAVCGKDLAALLERRIAFHHSGLSYAARAGVIEPLAKAGQLRVIAATMGLAAGINFSVRSVHVAATTFHDGVAEHKLTPDELLQMYGRAGRRGLDERGYVITARDSPSIMDARPARLHRSSLLAWPMFLRVMKHAALRKENPFAAAQQFAERLFARTPPLLGLEEHAPMNTLPLGQMNSGKALFGLEATEKQVFNTAGEWERRTRQEMQPTPLGEAWMAKPQRVAPALSVPSLLARFAHGIGRVGKIGEDRYGVEIPLGSPAAETPDLVHPTRNLRRFLKLPRSIATLPVEEIAILHWATLAQAILAQVDGALPGVLPELVDTMRKEGLIFARFRLDGVEVAAYEDSLGRRIFEPHERSILIRNATEVRLSDEPAANSAARDPRPGSPIHAWRALGLIDASGVPTRRGEIMSFFQHGEGLAIAAALEDDSYHLDDLVQHLANLRSGSKFDLPVAGGSERLAAVCRNTYGFVNHHGYLENGLPTDYGEGAAEVLDALLNPQRPDAVDLHRGLAEGDLSRTYVEWLSLLRHITHAPEYPWRRWMALRDEAGKALKKHGAAWRHLFHLDLPPLTNKQRHGKPRHYLMVKQ